MLGTTQNLPGDIAELQAILAVRDEEIAAGKAEIRVRDLLIEKLKHQLAGMRRHRFGPSSEALDQLALTPKVSVSKVSYTSEFVGLHTDFTEN